MTFVAVFFIPNPGSITSLNVVWITVLLLVSAIFLTLYIVPHTALIAVHLMPTAVPCFCKDSPHHQREIRKNPGETERKKGIC
jgi:hypothetical protein